MPFVLFFGRAIRAFFLLRAIDFVLTRPRRELSARPAHRVFQFLLFVSFLPCLFAGPVILFNDFYRAYLPGSFAARSALLRNALKILWGASKFYALGPVLHRAVENLHQWAYEGGGPAGIGPRSLIWGFLLLQIVDTFIRYSGFTDMAIGASRLLGFQIYENFWYPLLATNPLQFWKTWNISAYRWLMTHVFYPFWDHSQVLLKIQTTFVASALWHFSIAPRRDFDGGGAVVRRGGPVRLRGLGFCGGGAPRGSGAPRRPLAGGPPLAPDRRDGRDVRVHLLRPPGVPRRSAGRPLHSTWSDLTLLLGPAATVEPAGAQLDRDRLNEMIPNVEVEDIDGRAARLDGSHGQRRAGHGGAGRRLPGVEALRAAPGAAGGGVCADKGCRSCS